MNEDIGHEALCALVSTLIDKLPKCRFKFCGKPATIRTRWTWDETCDDHDPKDTEDGHYGISMDLPCAAELRALALVLKPRG